MTLAIDKEENVNNTGRQYKCRGCGGISRQKCPTCVQQNYPRSFFCGQECFQNNWNVHKKFHTILQAEKVTKPPKFSYSGKLRPHQVTPQLVVDREDIEKPDYALTGIPESEKKAYGGPIPVYKDHEIDKIRKVCTLGRQALDHIAHMIEPGITTDEQDQEIFKFITDHGAYPSPQNYYNFPKSVCTSVNEIICHGIPDLRPLQDGDIVNLDVSVYLDGYHADLNETHTVGDVDQETKDLVRVAYNALEAAANTIRPGTLFREFGDAITKYCNSQKDEYSIVRTYCGHGVGKLFHGPPSIPHYKNNRTRGICQKNMVFTIEPMINAGKLHQDITWPDGWTSATKSGKNSAQFEHTYLVTDKGYEILTARLPTSKKFWWEES